MLALYAVVAGRYQERISIMRTVVIEVRGGVADVTSQPDDIRVIVRDYDVKDIGHPGYKKDADGTEYAETVYP